MKLSNCFFLLLILVISIHFPSPVNGWEVIVDFDSDSTPKKENKFRTATISPAPPPTTGHKLVMMPYYHQGNTGLCWAAAAKILQKGYWSRSKGMRNTKELYQFMKLLNISPDEGILLPGLYPWPSKFEKLAAVIGGKGIQKLDFFTEDGVLEKVLELLNRGIPVWFGPETSSNKPHIVLVLGYRYDANNKLILIMHDSQDVNPLSPSKLGMYKEIEWDKAVKGWQPLQNFSLIFFNRVPNYERSLQTVILSDYSLFKETKEGVAFHGVKTKTDPEITLGLEFDKATANGIRWQEQKQQGKSVVRKNSNHFPANVNKMTYGVSLANADLKNMAPLKLVVKVYSKNNPSISVQQTSRKTLSEKSAIHVNGALNLESIQNSSKNAIECVLEISLFKDGVQIAKIQIDDFYLQSNLQEICPQKYDDSGNFLHIIRRQTGKEQYTLCYYYSNDQLERSTPYDKNKNRHGIERAYWKSGALYNIIPFFNDNKHGTEKWYYESGKLRYWARINHGNVIESKSYVEVEPKIK